MDIAARGQFDAAAWEEQPFDGTFRVEAYRVNQNTTSEVWAIDIDSLEDLTSLVNRIGRIVIEDEGYRTSAGNKMLSLTVWEDGVDVGKG